MNDDPKDWVLDNFQRVPHDLFVRYLADPLALDGEVRQAVGLPADRYYTVSVWPAHVAGRVFLTGSRAVRDAKISKSNQQP